MGRLRTARARALCSVAFVVLAPLLALIDRHLTMASGVPAVSLGLGLVVAYLLSVGPRGAVLVVGLFTLDAVVGPQLALSAPLVLVAAAQTAVTVAGILLVERRLRWHGSVRNAWVMLEFGLIAALLVPLLLHATGWALRPALDLAGAPAPHLAHVLADGLGVLVLTVGLRVLVMGQRVVLSGRRWRALLAAAAATSASALAMVRFVGIDALAGAQVVVLPIFLLALLVGSAAYSIAIAVTTVAVVVPLAVWADPGTWAVSSTTQAVWWTVAFAGLLLATDGDRRRGAALELRTFLMRSATPTVSVDVATGEIRLANHEFAALMDCDVDDLVGTSIRTIGADQPQVRARLDRLLDGREQECTNEFGLSIPGVGDRWVRCTAVRVDLGGPQPDVLQIQLLDLTAEREREAALQRSNEALERFGRRVTHDLKQPVAAVATYASTLLEHAEQMDPAVVRTMYERLEAVAQLAVKQLDDTFRATAVTTTGPVVVNLHEVVASVVGVVDIDLAEAGGSVDTALTVSRVHADASVLRQVLLNLLTNSLKYARDDTPPRIRIAARVRGAGVELTVTDNGTGVPHDALEDVFERGVRLAPNRAEGRGHGLADSRELAEDAGGWLQAEPWADGARFVLWLPDAGVSGVGHVTRVLIVEDDPDTRSMLEQRLATEPSIEVVGAAALLDEAVRATRELRPDVVLLDRWLHDQDGLSAVVELARAHPDVRVILLTADMSPGIDERARSGGALGVIDKAMSGDDLVAHLVGGSTPN